MKPKVFISDIVIILLAAALAVFSVYSAYLRPQGDAHVLIQGQGSEWAFPLDVDETIAVNGPLGDTIVKIHENRAWVESSPCENQTCVSTGLISKAGQWSACLPNSVLIVIKGMSDENIDAVVW